MLSNKQLRAIFAKLHERKTKTGVGVTTAALGTLLATRARTRLLGLGLAGAGTAFAAGYGDKYLAHTATQATAAKHKAQNLGSLAKAGGRGVAAVQLEKARNFPIEKFLGPMIDVPFSAAESLISGEIQKRAGRISEFAAKRIGAAQMLTNIKAGELARQGHAKLFKLSPQESASLQKKAAAGIEANLKHLTAPNRKLRTEAHQIKLHRGIMQAVNDMVREGQLEFKLTEGDVERIIRMQNIPDTPENRLALKRGVAAARFFGTSNLAA